MPISPGFVTLNVTAATREDVRALAYALTGAAGRRVTLSDAIRAAVALAQQRPSEARAAVLALTTDASHTTDAPTTPTREDDQT